MTKMDSNRKRISKKEIAAIIVAAIVCVVAALFVCGVAFGGWLSANSGRTATGAIATVEPSATSNAENAPSSQSTSDNRTSESSVSNENSGGADASASSSNDAATTANASEPSASSTNSPDNASTDSSSSSSSSSQGSSSAAQPASITVTLTIDSSRAHAYNNAWPESMGSSTLTLSDGANVYDALCQMGVTIKGSSTYVSSINGLGEFACGSKSGWVYQVNGATPNMSCGRYTLHGGETIVWIYTCDYEADGF